MIYLTVWAARKAQYWFGYPGPRVHADQIITKLRYTELRKQFPMTCKQPMETVRMLKSN